MNEEERNHWCLSLLLSRVGNPCLRHYFKNQWNAAGRYTPWTDCAQNGADLVQILNPLQNHERNKVRSGDTSQWDLSLFVKALLHSRPPFVVADNLVAALETLIKMRNKLCHSSSLSVKATDFQKSWIDGCIALKLFGATTVDFDKVKQDVQKPWSELLPMMKHCANQDKAILDQLDLTDNKLKELGEGQKTLVEGQTTLQKGQDTILQGQEDLFKKLEEVLSLAKGSHAGLERGGDEVSIRNALRSPKEIADICGADVSIRNVGAEYFAKALAAYLKLDKSSLQDPPEETVKNCRIMCIYLKKEERVDIINELRKELPSGLTGPLADEDALVKDMIGKLEDLTKSLCGDDKWKKLADHLGIRRCHFEFYGRKENPAESILEDVCHKRNLKVGDLYDVLCKCDFNALADQFL